MDKQEIYNYLKEENISYEITNHKAVYNMEEASEIDIPYPNQDAKNLFVRDDKKKNYYLITVKGNKRIDLKEFSLKNNTRRLSFASKEDLMKIMKLIPGYIRMFLYPIIVHQYHPKKNIYRAKFPHSKNVFNEYCCIGSCRSCFPYSDNENWGMKSILFNETIK